MNNKKITLLFVLTATMALLGIVGFTVAYFTSSVDFENEFTTGLFQTEATETFTSPENWLPGDTTPKTLTIENTGNANVKARVCISEEWESDNGDPLPNKVNGERAAILNLANTSDWTYRLGCYEYNDVLEPDDVTSSFIESVTFNPNIESDMTCEITTSNGSTTKTCSSSGDGYDNATYTLTFRVETAQASSYKLAWGYDMGDEKCYDTECFYVVSSNSNETVLLSKYNLLVGNIYEFGIDTKTLVKTLSPSDEGYGLQNSEAKGYIESQGLGLTHQVIGTVPFSGTNYWDNSVCQYTGSSWGCTGTSELLPDYSPNGEDYSSHPFIYRSNIGNTTAPYINNDIVQNNGYTIAYFVETYVNTLKTLGAPETISGRLLSYDEVESLGCIDIWCASTSYGEPVDGRAPDWVFSTSYWFGFASSKEKVSALYSMGNIQSQYFTEVYRYGVRPVIVVKTSDI